MFQTDFSILYKNNSLEEYQSVFKDENLLHGIFYDISTSSIFWNRASVVFLPKVYAATAPLALLCLLQKEAHALLLWQQEWKDTTPSIEEFINTITAWGRFTNTQEKNVAVGEFWVKFNDTIQGLINEPDVEFTKDGITQPYTPILVEKELIKAICFDDSWKQQSFFIKTKQQWILYYWSTGT